MLNIGQIEEGFVLDHIEAGKSLSIYHHLKLDKQDCTVAIIKNAKYLLLSNSSFAYFPAFTSTTVKYILAPKYWARHNVSNGYWASEQNIYEGWHYQDRRGRVFSAEECRAQLQEYKEKAKAYRRLNQRPEGALLFAEQVKSKVRYTCYKCLRIARSIRRKVKLLIAR